MTFPSIIRSGSPSAARKGTMPPKSRSTARALSATVPPRWGVFPLRPRPRPPRQLGARTGAPPVPSTGSPLPGEEAKACVVGRSLSLSLCFAMCSNVGKASMTRVTWLPAVQRLTRLTHPEARCTVVLRVVLAAGIGPHAGSRRARAVRRIRSHKKDENLSDHRMPQGPLGGLCVPRAQTRLH